MNPGAGLYGMNLTVKVFIPIHFAQNSTIPVATYPYSFRIDYALIAIQFFIAARVISDQSWNPCAVVNPGFYVQGTAFCQSLNTQ